MPTYEFVELIRKLLNNGLHDAATLLLDSVIVTDERVDWKPINWPVSNCLKGEYDHENA